MLGDHGADVIQVVAPDRAASIRADGLSMGSTALDTQRNKRSVALDLKSDPGRQALWALIATADVLVTNVRSGALERLGFSAAEVRARHPRLIYCLANGS